MATTVLATIKKLLDTINTRKYGDIYHTGAGGGGRGAAGGGRGRWQRAVARSCVRGEAGGWPGAVAGGGGRVVAGGGVMGVAGELGVGDTGAERDRVKEQGMYVEMFQSLRISGVCRDV